MVPLAFASAGSSGIVCAFRKREPGSRRVYPEHLDVRGRQVKQKKQPRRDGAVAEVG